MSNRNVWGSCFVKLHCSTQQVLVQMFHCLRKREFEKAFDHCTHQNLGCELLYIPDLLTEVTYMAAFTAKVLKGTAVERFLFATIK